MNSRIPAHSPFLPGETGNCIFAVCHEADEKDVIQEICQFLNSAAGILYLIMREGPEDSASALRGALRLIELAEGLTKALGVLEKD